MRKIVVLVAVIISLLNTKLVLADGFSSSLILGFDSEYLAKPGFVVYNKPIWWTNIHLGQNGWYWNSWSSLGLGEIEDSYGNELDLTGGKKFSLAGCLVDLSGSYFLIGKKFGESKNDFWIFDGRVDFPDKVPWVTPWVATRYFGRIGSESPGAGWFFWAGVQRTQPLDFVLPFQKDVFAVSFDAFSVFSAGGAFHGDAGPVYFRLVTSTKITITETISFSPAVIWQAPLQGLGNYTDGQNHVVPSVSLAYAF